MRSQYDSIANLFRHNQDAALASMAGGSIRVKAEAEEFTHRTFIDLQVLRANDSAAVLRQQQYLSVVRSYVRGFLITRFAEPSSHALPRKAWSIRSSRWTIFRRAPGATSLDAARYHLLKSGESGLYYSGALSSSLLSSRSLASVLS